MTFEHDVLQLEIIETETAKLHKVEVRETEDGHQQDQSRYLREHEELHRRISTILVAPDNNNEIHRNQHHFPEEEEQEQIERGEHPDHTSQRPQQVEVEEAGPLGDLIPRGAYRNQAKEDCERQHQQ